MGRLTPPTRGTPANIWLYLILSETRIIDLHFAADSMGLSLFRFFSGRLRKTIFFRKSAFWPFKVIQGH